MHGLGQNPLNIRINSAVLGTTEIHMKYRSILLALSIVVSACGGTSIDDAPAVSIDGTWEGCVNTDSSSRKFYAIHDNGEYSDISVEYTLPNCQGELTGTTNSSAGLYTIGAPRVLENGMVVTDVIWTFKSETSDEPTMCYTFFGFEGDLLFFGKIDDTFDCSSEEKRPVVPDYESISQRIF